MIVSERWTPGRQAPFATVSAMLSPLSSPLSAPASRMFIDLAYWPVGAAGRSFSGIEICTRGM